MRPRPDAFQWHVPREALGRSPDPDATVFLKPVLLPRLPAGSGGDGFPSYLWFRPLERSDDVFDHGRQDFLVDGCGDVVIQIDGLNHIKSPFPGI